MPLGGGDASPYIAEWTIQGKVVGVIRNLE